METNVKFQVNFRVTSVVGVVVICLVQYMLHTAKEATNFAGSIGFESQAGRPEEAQTEKSKSDTCWASVARREG